MLKERVSIWGKLRKYMCKHFLLTPIENFEDAQQSFREDIEGLRKQNDKLHLKIITMESKLKTAERFRQEVRFVPFRSRGTLKLKLTTEEEAEKKYTAHLRVLAARLGEQLLYDDALNVRAVQTVALTSQNEALISTELTLIAVMTRDKAEANNLEGRTI